MNDHEFHNHVEFVIKCQKLRIILFQFYFHTTHICQSLNVICFQFLKHYHRQIIDVVVRFDEKTQYTKIDFLITFQQIRKFIFIINIVLSTFKRTDLIFYFFDIVFDKLRVEFHVEKRLKNANARASKLNQKKMLKRISENVTSKIFLKQFDVYDRYIIEQLNKDFNLINFKNVFAKIFKNVKAKMHTKKFLKNKIATQISVITARKKRNKNNKRINHFDFLTVAKIKSKMQARSQLEKLQNETAKKRKDIKDFKI